MDKSVPVLAITDNTTDLKDILKSAENGYFSPAGDLQNLSKTIKQIIQDKDQLATKGENGRKYLENNFDVKNSYEVIMKHFK